MNENSAYVLPKDKRVKEISEKPIENVSDYISKIKEYMESRKGENYSYVYRASPRFIPPPAAPTFSGGASWMAILFLRRVSLTP